MISKDQSGSVLVPLFVSVIVYMLNSEVEVMKMWMNKRRVEQVQERALGNLDYVMECREAPDFVEVTGSIGGDIVTYRVYDNGDVYAR